MENCKTVRHRILERIRERAYQPGARIAPLRILAKDWGTSFSTVARAVSQLTQEGYLRNEPGRGYFVSPFGAEAGRRLQSTGVLLSYEPQNYAEPEWPALFRDTLAPIQAGCLQSGSSLTLIGGVVRRQGRYRPIEPWEIQERRLAGLLTLGICDVPFLAQVQAIQPRLVALDVDASSVGVASISFDNRGSAVELVRRLAARGARRIGCLTGPLLRATNEQAKEDSPFFNAYDPSADERHDGWRLGLQALGLECSPELSQSAADRGDAAIREGARALLRRTRPDAILTEFPDVTLKALGEAGLRPQDVLVTGWLPGTAPDGWLPGLAAAARCDFRALGLRGLEVLETLERTAEAPDQAVLRVLLPLVVEEQGHGT